MDTQVDTAQNDLDTLLASLEADATPEAIKALDSGAKDQQGPASHAFAEQKRKAKEAAALIRKQQDELTAFKKAGEDAKKQADAARVQQAQQQRGNAAPDMDAILQSLVVQAMQGLGIYQVTTPVQQRLLDLEVQRLYTEQVTQARQQYAAQQTAPGIVQAKLGAFEGKLDEAGMAEVKKRLGKYPILQQTDDGVIRGVIAQYLGELELSGDSATDAGGEGNMATGDAAPVTDAKAASVRASVASTARNGSRGLTVHGGDGQRKPGPKPATQEEIEEMTKLKMTDLQAYRAAKGSKNKYLNH